MDISQLVSRYLETWNETDPAARREAVTLQAGRHVHGKVVVTL